MKHFLKGIGQSPDIPGQIWKKNSSNPIYSYKSQLFLKLVPFLIASMTHVKTNQSSMNHDFGKQTTVQGFVTWEDMSILYCACPESEGLRRFKEIC